MTKVNTILAVTVALFILAGIACEESTPKLETRPASTPDAEPTPTLGQKVAVIDGESMDSAHANRADYLLPKIAQWCADSVPAERVGDMAVTSRDILLEQYGVEVNILEVLEGVNEGTLGTSAGIFKCEEAFSLYVILRGQ